MPPPYWLQLQLLEADDTRPVLSIYQPAQLMAGKPLLELRYKDDYVANKYLLSKCMKPHLSCGFSVFSPSNPLSQERWHLSFFPRRPLAVSPEGCVPAPTSCLLELPPTDPSPWSVVLALPTLTRPLWTMLPLEGQETARLLAISSPQALPRPTCTASRSPGAPSLPRPRSCHLTS